MYYSNLYEVRPSTDLKDMLASSVEFYADRTAFLRKNGPSDSYQPVTYRQFKEDVEALGTAMMGLGLADNSIAVISENRYEWVVTYLAVLNGVGTIVPLDKELPENE